MPVSPSLVYFLCSMSSRARAHARFNCMQHYYMYMYLHATFALALVIVIVIDCCCCCCCFIFIFNGFPWLVFSLICSYQFYSFPTCLTRFNATKHFFDTMSWYPTGPISQSAHIKYFVFCIVFEKPIFSKVNISSTVQ